MSVDNDIERFNQGLDDLFDSKPIQSKTDKLIRHEEQKAPWHKKRTRRTNSDTYSMVCSYTHHEGDRRWLVAQLQTMPLSKREAAMAQYAEQYERCYQREPNLNKRDGEARRKANSWLVDLLMKISK